METKQVTLRRLIDFRGILLPVVFALLLLATASSWAASRFDVFVGFDNLLPDKGWFPVTCEVQNDGPSFNAVIEISPAQLGQGQSRRVKLDLPSGTLKRVVIPVFSGAPTWSARLLDEHDHVHTEQTSTTARTIPADLPLVVGISRNYNGLPVFPDLPGRFQGALTSSTYRAARLTPTQLPDNPLALESIDVLYLNSEKALELTLPQATALKAWLEHGGHLVLGVEQSSDISGNPWLRDLIPCEVTTAQNVADHTNLQAWLQAPWANSRFQTPNRPVNLPGPRGGGSVPGGYPVEIQGVVLSPDGKPVQGATVYLGDQNVIRGALRPAEAKTDADGKFTLAGNAFATALVAAGAPDFAPVIKSTSTAQGAPRVELRLAPPQTLNFRVLDTNGQPAYRAAARITRWQTFNFPPMWGTLMTDTNGEFTITNAPADSFNLQVSSTNGVVGLLVTPTNRSSNEIVLRLNSVGRRGGPAAGVRGGRAAVVATATPPGMAPGQVQIGPPPRVLNTPQSPPVSSIITDDTTFDAAPLPILAGPLSDGAILIGDEAAPLAVTADRGRGRITVLTFSPEREPFLSWKDRGLFWAKLAGIPRTRLESGDNQPNMAQMGTDGIFGAMIDSKQVRKLPLGWLLVLLAAYLIVIGPLDQYWLKKLNRQMLTWITFPLYVVGFSGLIYLIGFHLRAGELEWNELNVVDVFPNEDRAILRGETYVSIYSPVNAHFDLASSQPYATLRGESAGIYGGRSDNGQVSVVQLGNTFQARAFVPVWTSQLFVSDWLQASPEVPVTLSAVKQDSGWTVKVTNQSNRKLTHAHVAVGGRLFDLGDLDPRQTKTSTIYTTNGTLLISFAGQKVDSFRNAVNARRNSFGNNTADIQNIEEAAMSIAFLDTTVGDPNQGYNNFGPNPSLDLNRYSDPFHAIFLAWDADHSFAAPLNSSPIQRTHRNTLLRLVVPVKTLEH
jgi:hypothetical protein